MNYIKINLRTILLFIIIYLFYVAGILFPESWWSTHFLYFLSTSKQIIYLVLALAMPFLFIYFSTILNKEIKNKVISAKYKTVIILLISIILGLVMYYFPMVFDYYGEAIKLQKFLTIIPEIIPAGTNQALFSFSLSPWAGQNTILSIVTYIAYWTGTTYQNAFYILDAVTGALFSFTWLLFINFYLKKNATKLMLVIAGLASPFMLTFFGHIEIYGLIFLFNLLWLVLALTFLKREKPAYLLILAILLFFNLKLHSVALLFVPVYLLLLFRHFKPEIVKTKAVFSWNKIGTFVLFPILLIGAFFYFFVFKDFNDTRHIQYTVGEYERLFLPLISPPAPLENYNMLSWNHIFDYFNEILLWSPGILFLIVISVVSFRKNIKWNAPDLIISGVSLILFATLFFVVNPLLTMQMDWDLFIMPAPLLLVFGAVVISQAEDKINTPAVAGSVISIALLVLPIFVVHNSETKLANRLELVGIRIFKTYYEWSAQTLNLAWSHLPEDKNTLEQRKTDVLKQLKPFAVPGKDYEYAKLIAQKAKVAIREESNSEKGLELLKQADYYYANLNISLLYKLEAYFLLKDFSKAFEISEKLIEKKYPSEEKALRISVHCAIEAEMFKNALEISEIYIQKFGTSGVIFEVNKRIKSNNNIYQIKELFADSSSKN